MPPNRQLCFTIIYSLRTEIWNVIFLSILFTSCTVTSAIISEVMSYSSVRTGPLPAFRSKLLLAGMLPITGTSSQKTRGSSSRLSEVVLSWWTLLPVSYDHSTHLGQWVTAYSPNRAPNYFLCVVCGLTSWPQAMSKAYGFKRSPGLSFQTNTTEHLKTEHCS